MHNSIPLFLIGPMGSGKSAVGKRLAQQLGRTFVDTDHMVEERCGVDVAFVFEKEGEEGFRQREIEALRDAAALPDVVVATGGGIVTRSENRALLAETGIVIFLETSPEQQYARTRHNNARPLLDVSDPQAKLRGLWQEREPLYRSLADLTVTTNSQRVVQVSNKAHALIKTFDPTAKLAMRTLSVNLPNGHYPIHIGAGILSRTSMWAVLAADNRLPKTIMIVSDENVAPLYLNTLETMLAAQCSRVDILTLPAGEQNKKLVTLEKILDELVANGHSRDTGVVALGGGVVGDMTGFAAASFMRGVRFLQVPTTLLAQVDSSVGGKTGINHASGKNLIGAFHQPQAVVIDTQTLTSLPRREVCAGLAEVIKYGCIFDADFFAWLEQNIAALLALDEAALTYAIERSCAIKAAIVARDELERGERALLNFGHTFGHAVEQVTGYNTWLHGEAVAIGMHMAMELSCRMSLCTREEQQRLSKLLTAAELPLSAGPLDHQALLDAMSKDKKNTVTERRMIVLNGLGRSEVRTDCAETNIKHALDVGTQSLV